MLNGRSTFYQDLNNQKGQVALFVALIFQILFLFFAMVINVGLLVHHKINLQNAVDLAAYYGAMRQAEGMNVIAHTNYQIRQSWKLLAWRYRMLGSAGDFEVHPFDKRTGGNKGAIYDGIDSAAENFYEAPAFCITYVPFAPMPPGENTCKGLNSFSGIDVFKVPPVFIDLPGVSHAVRSLSAQIRSNVFRRCRDFGAWNYIVLGGFVVAFNIDQAYRSYFISTLSQAMSPDDPYGDFYDIDGKSVHEGIINTLKNNLTPANRAKFTANDVKIFNSLGDPQCNKSGVASGAPAKWLKPIKIAPGFKYIDTTCQGDRVAPIGRILGTERNNLPKHNGGDEQNHLTPEVERLKPYIRVAQPPIDDPYNFSVGVEKNPYCMAYVGVKATTEPSIPFSPLGSIKLTARAFYKPFGGRIGPWYMKKWEDKNPRGNGSGTGRPEDRTDPNLPPRVFDLSNLGADTDPSRAANFSRFVGDKFGLKSRIPLYEYGKAVYGLNPSWRNKIDLSTGDTSTTDPIDTSDAAPNFEHWKHLPFSFAARGGSQDIMAWASDGPSRMRDLEMSAVLPDAFDMAYYSIEPDFYHTYYTRLRDGFLKGVGAGFYGKDREFLGDIGTHKGYKNGEVNYDEFSVKDQYKVVYGNSSHFKSIVNYTSDPGITYIGSKWEQLLTGWAPKSLMDYSLDTNKLGKCNVEALPEVPTSGHCVSGGTTGYSVKMVSPVYLRSDIPNINGGGVNDKILNQPPADEDF